MRREIYPRMDSEIKREKPLRLTTTFLKNITLGERWWTYNLSVGKVVSEKKKTDINKSTRLDTELKLIHNEDQATLPVENKNADMSSKFLMDSNFDERFFLQEERFEELIDKVKKERSNLYCCCDYLISDLFYGWGYLFYTVMKLKIKYKNLLVNIKTLIFMYQIKILSIAPRKNW